MRHIRWEAVQSAKFLVARSTAVGAAPLVLRVATLLRGPHPGIALNEHYVGDGDIVYRQACKLGCEGIVSKRLGSLYRSGRSKH